MEPVIRMAIYNYMERNNLLSREQLGFRVGHSCLTNFFNTREDRAAGNDENIPVDVMFMDLMPLGLKLKLESLRIHYEIT